MKCFNHENLDALGQCKHCYKGLCKACATDTGCGIACKDEHEKEVELLNSLIDNNLKAYASTPKSILMSNLFLLLMGVLFIAYHLFFSGSKFILWFGILCSTYWLVLAIYNFFFLKKIKTDYDT